MVNQEKVQYPQEAQAENGQVTWREERSERTTQRRADRNAGGFGYIVGAVLIAVGLFNLLQNTGYIPIFENWWALFMLLPAAGALSVGLGAYRHNGGELTAAVMAPFIGSMLFIGLTMAFVFDLNFGWLWPLALIAGGLMLLGGSMRSKS